MTAMEQPHFLGIVRVPIPKLLFKYELGKRRLNHNHVKNLEELFMNTTIDVDNNRHWIKGYIDNALVQDTFNQLGLSQEALHLENAWGAYPLLDREVVYTQGQHRIRAAKGIPQYWTIMLYAVPMCRLQSNRVVEIQANEYQHELPYSDGHIYAKLRYYRDDDFNFAEWNARLRSKEKQEAFKCIAKRPAIMSVLDKLTAVEGLIECLHLGNLRKIFVQRLELEFLAGLERIHKVWCQDPLMMSCADWDTVLTLEGRAPTISSSDTQCIRSTFQEHRAFSGIADGYHRNKIEHNMLTTPGIIPGLRSLQANMQHLCIAADIIWSCLISPELRLEAKVNGFSLRQVLESQWTANQPYVEIAEGVFQPIRGPPSFLLVYVQLILSALRLFPYLSNIKPKVEKKEKMFLSQDLRYIAAFHDRAQLLGLRTPSFDEDDVDWSNVCSEQWGPPRSTISINESELLKQLNHRWGRPYNSLYRVIQTQAFLPTLQRSTAGRDLTVGFLLRDFLSSHFGFDWNFELDYSSPSITLPRRENPYQRRSLPSSPGWQPSLHPIEEATETVFSSDSRMDVDRISDSDVPMQDVEDITSEAVSNFRGATASELQLQGDIPDLWQPAVITSQGASNEMEIANGGNTGRNLDSICYGQRNTDQPSTTQELSSQMEMVNCVIMRGEQQSSYHGQLNNEQPGMSPSLAGSSSSPPSLSLPPLMGECADYQSEADSSTRSCSSHEPQSIMSSPRLIRRDSSLVSLEGNLGRVRLNSTISPRKPRSTLPSPVGLPRRNRHSRSRSRVGRRENRSFSRRRSNASRRSSATSMSSRSAVADFRLNTIKVEDAPHSQRSSASNDSPVCPPVPRNSLPTSYQDTIHSGAPLSVCQSSLSSAYETRSDVPRSTCPTPPAVNGRLHSPPYPEADWSLQHRKLQGHVRKSDSNGLSANWQGFIDSSDEMEVIDLE